MRSARLLKRPNRARKLFTVEKILEHKYENGIIKYRVKWLNFDYSHCTWEPFENFTDPNFVGAYNRMNGIECPSLIGSESTREAVKEPEVVKEPETVEIVEFVEVFKEPEPLPVKKENVVEQIFAHRLVGGTFIYKVRGGMGDCYRFTWKQANEFEDGRIVDEYNKQAGIGIFSSNKPLRIVAQDRDADDRVIFLIERQRTKNLEYVHSDWMIMKYPAIVNCYLDP